MANACAFCEKISIHAPRVGSDAARMILDLSDGISIHAPRVGSDVISTRHPMPQIPFQSTLPVWGATPLPKNQRRTKKHFNPRSPCGERQAEQHGGDVELIISIHAPRVGSDGMAMRVHRRFGEFQSTLPVWGATMIVAVSVYVIYISIHAPRVGSDCGKP